MPDTKAELVKLGFTLPRVHANENRFGIRHNLAIFMASRKTIVSVTRQTFGRNSSGVANLFSTTAYDLLFKRSIHSCPIA